jgi:hypothetical protein
MKFGPRQFVGLSVLVVYCGILGWSLFKPRHDPRPPPAVAASSVGTSADPGVTVQFAEDPLTIGSTDAKDDLYCSGLIFAAYRAGDPAATLETQTRRDYVLALADSGVARLLADHAAEKSETAGIADAQANAAEADFVAKAPRIALAACIARAASAVQQPIQQ